MKTIEKLIGRSSDFTLFTFAFPEITPSDKRRICKFIKAYRSGTVQDLHLIPSSYTTPDKNCINQSRTKDNLLLFKINMSYEFNSKNITFASR